MANNPQVAAEYQERVKLFRDTIDMKHTDRVPNLANVFTWKIFDAGVGLTEAMRDSKKMMQLVCDFHERYHFDAYMDLGQRNPLRVLDAMGNSYYEITDDGINVVDHVIMEPEEYPEYAKDHALFQWTKLMKRKFPNAKGEQIGNAVWELLMHARYTDEVADKFIKEYGCPSVYAGANVIMLPYEYFFQTARGIKNMGRDVRKYKDGLIAAMDAQFEKSVVPTLQYALSQDTSEFVCDTYTAIIGYGILSEKQFGEVYWPYVKRALEMVRAAGKTTYIFCEGQMMRYAEFFEEIPKGTVILHVESDDIFEVRKRLPNLCLAGGMKTELLGNATPAECVDYAKRLVEEMGPGYVFSQDKMLSFKNDCRRENLLAVNDFVRNYRR